MKARYTPGPWTVSSTGIWATGPWNARVCIADITIFSPTNGIDWQANAQLMSQSPRLHSSLRRLRDVVVAMDAEDLNATPPSTDEYDAAISEASAAIEAAMETAK